MIPTLISYLGSSYTAGYYASHLNSIIQNIESLIHEVNMAYNFLLFCNKIESRITCPTVQKRFVEARNNLRLLITTISQNTQLIKLFQQAKTMFLSKSSRQHDKSQKNIDEIEKIITEIRKTSTDTESSESSEPELPSTAKPSLKDRFVNFAKNTTAALSNNIWVSVTPAYYRTELNILVNILNTIVTEIIESTNTSYNTCSMDATSLIGSDGILDTSKLKALSGGRSIMYRSSKKHGLRYLNKRSGLYRSKRKSCYNNCSSRKRKYT